MSYFLFPGQGSQTPGMGYDFYEASPPAREIFDRASDILGSEFLETIFNGTAEALQDTRIAQTALVTTGVAIAAHLAAQGITPAGCAGHSIGEIAALVVVESIAFEDAIELTRERARLMHEESPPGSMAAVIGLEPDAIASALPEGVDIANFNGPGQTIISGPLDALDRAKIQLLDAGARKILPLRVSGPFHSSCMDDAARKLQSHTKSLRLSKPKCRFISSVSGKVETDPESIRELLWKQLAAPVRWTDVMLAIGAEPALEVGPGKALRGIARRIEGGPMVSGAGSIEAINTLRSEV